MLLVRGSAVRVAGERAGGEVFGTTVLAIGGRDNSFEALASVRDTVDEARRAAPYAVAALLAAALVAALTVVAVNAPALIDGVATEAPAPLPGFEDMMDFQ